mgnify:CR=1 FL=1
MSDLFEAAGLDQGAPTPLAERLRPRKLDEVVGQDHLLKPEGPIGRMVAQKRLSSMVLWGPPGVGKTTIARLLAEETGHEFQQISAVFSGVADLKKAFETAKGRRASGKASKLTAATCNLRSPMIVLARPARRYFFGTVRRHCQSSSVATAIRLAIPGNSSIGKTKPRRIPRCIFP